MLGGSGSNRRPPWSGHSDEISEAGTLVPTPPRSPPVMGHDVSDAETDEEVDPRLQALEANPKILDTLERLSARVDYPRRISFSDQAPPSERSEDPTLISGVDRLIARLNATDQENEARTPERLHSTAPSLPRGRPRSRSVATPRFASLPPSPPSSAGPAAPRPATWRGSSAQTGRRNATQRPGPWVASWEGRVTHGGHQPAGCGGDLPSVYGLRRALGEIHCEADWLKPGASKASVWKSKITWALLDECV